MNQGNLNSTGGGVKRRICHDDIFNEIISLENLFSAWREFSKGKLKKPDVLEFKLNLEDNLFGLHYELKDKSWRHSHYTAFNVYDPKLRRIHKACVRDRVLHHAIFRVLYPIFDKSFIFDSYSCRLGKGTHRAVNRLNSFTRQLSHNNSRNIFALKCDVRKFFDSINQSILLKLISEKIKDDNALWLIETIIKSFQKEPKKGLPLGNVTSQLFANIYLKLMINGISSRGFSASTLQRFSKPEITFRDDIIAASRKTYANPKADVEKAIAEWAGSSGEESVGGEEERERRPRRDYGESFGGGRGQRFPDHGRDDRGRDDRFYRDERRDNRPPVPSAPRPIVQNQSAPASLESALSSGPVNFKGKRMKISERVPKPKKEVDTGELKKILEESLKK